jgi:hypothetical protein
MPVRKRPVTSLRFALVVMMGTACAAIERRVFPGGIRPPWAVTVSSERGGAARGAAISPIHGGGGMVGIFFRPAGRFPDRGDPLGAGKLEAIPQQTLDRGKGILFNDAIDLRNRWVDKIFALQPQANRDGRLEGWQAVRRMVDYRGRRAFQRLRRKFISNRGSTGIIWRYPCIWSAIEFNAAAATRPLPSQ